MYQPSQDGAKIYLSGNPDLNNVISKIVAAVGSIQMPETGHMAFFTNSEGNGVALTSITSNMLVNSTAVYQYII